MRKLAIFFSYVKLLVFLGAFAVGSYFLYQKLYPAPPYELAGRRPSEILAPIMKEKLPSLFKDLKDGDTISLSDLTAIKKAFSKGSSVEGAMQAAYAKGSDLCTEIEELGKDREIAREAWMMENKDRLSMVSHFFRSTLANSQQKQRIELFAKKPTITWNTEKMLHRESIKRMYVQMVQAETPLAKSDKIQCPLCKGEGRIMLRRMVTGTVNDLSTSCPLCLGTGGRMLKLPANASICPDCDGFGRRLVVQQEPETRGDGNILKPGSQLGDGIFAANAPAITGCSRCLSRGYILNSVGASR